ncbi:Nucleoside-diphosphate-sugar epimerase [Pseudomonas sp. LAMO17WK12:I6]|jgi:nucleoside-diphosphate-sugar epimerase|uniref:GDP-mannose 4,6-dehydratase n=1 Tax=Pseudomonas TaxID=286 RepID=UPI000BCFCE10|nr:MULTISPECIES: GDP-mannose 4,6-dehydratase [unclassified Pseudomonas]SNY27063.1 Nucleoside-diphosphate-sugar epimerase [Pseudomonas sp. LAMO17WK12:I6]SNY29016.1 Nucleoside-diphosphate-sugar epimerase [Pseudomonas sp. LAMO17WK12:I5]
MIIAGKRVLVTGVNGFTGRYLSSELRSFGYDVVGLGTQPAHEENYQQVDLSDLEGLRNVLRSVQPDFVVHLAALAFVEHRDVNAFYEVNLIGTRNLLEAIADSGKTPDCVLLVSSANVYGNTSEGLLSESTLPAPANDYAVSKLAMEYMAKLWMKKLPIVIARPFNYTGVGQSESFLLPKIVSHFRQKADHIELGNLNVSRDFSDVRSLVHAYRLLLEARPLGKVINVSSGVSHSLQQVLDICSALTGHKVDVEVNPAFVRVNEVKSLCGDNTLLKKFVPDWETPPLAETLSWMLTAE